MYVCNFLWVDKSETNIYLEQHFYLLIKTWKYGNGFGTEAAGGA